MNDQFLKKGDGKGKLYVTGVERRDSTPEAARKGEGEEVQELPRDTF